MDTSISAPDVASQPDLRFRQLVETRAHGLIGVTLDGRLYRLTAHEIGTMLWVPLVAPVAAYHEVAL